MFLFIGTTLANINRFTIDNHLFTVKMEIKWEIVVNCGKLWKVMELLTGEYQNTLDEKGRILFPSKLRSEISTNVLVLTKAMDKCLWLFTPESWSDLSEKVMAHASPFDASKRAVVRHLIAPAVTLEFDKAGRLSIPQSLREYAGLSKDCVVLGINRYIELWDAATYQEYQESTKEELLSATEGLTDICF